MAAQCVHEYLVLTIVCVTIYIRPSQPKPYPEDVEKRLIHNDILDLGGVTARIHAYQQGIR